MRYLPLFLCGIVRRSKQKNRGNAVIANLCVRCAASELCPFLCSEDGSFSAVVWCLFITP